MSKGRFSGCLDVPLDPVTARLGPLAVALSAFAAYQEKEAWTWERMAMTRARTIAGNAGLGARVSDVLRKNLSLPRDAAATRKDIAQMRALMLKEHNPTSLWDVKRAKGGQVEIEFIAQALELVGAMRHPELLNPNTHAVLAAAGKAGVLAAADCEVLASALALYQRFTHILRLCIDGEFKPETAPAHLRNTLARAAGQPDLATTEVYLAETQEKVARIFEKLIGRPD